MGNNPVLLMACVALTWCCWTATAWNFNDGIISSDNSLFNLVSLGCTWSNSRELDAASRKKEGEMSGNNPEIAFLSGTYSGDNKRSNQRKRDRARGANFEWN